MYQPEVGLFAFLTADPAILELIQDKPEPPRIFPEKVHERVSRLLTCIRYEVDTEEGFVLASGPSGMGVAEILCECRASTLAKARQLEQRIRESRGGNPDGRKFDDFVGNLGAGYVAQKMQIKSAMVGEEKPTKATDASVYFITLDITLAWNTQTASTQSQFVSGLLAYYTMSDLNDSSGNGRTLTNVNGVTFVAGKVGNASDHEADTFQRLSSTDAGFSLTNTSFTLAAWVKPESFHPNRQYIFNKFDTVAGQTGYALRVTGSGTVEFLVGNAGSNTLAHSTTLVAGTWYFLCARYDHTAQLLKLRVNDVDAAALSHTYGVGNDATVTFTMGSWNGGDFFWDGLIDEAGLWNRALTDVEVATLYNAGSGRTWPLP